VGEAEEAADAVHHCHDRGVDEPAVAEVVDVELDVSALDAHEWIESVVSHHLNQRRSW
jgi:hypothetical protein